METIQEATKGDWAREKRRSFSITFTIANLRRRFAEYVNFDATFLQKPLALIFYLAGRFLYLIGKKRKGLRLLCSVHRSAFSAWSSRAVERFLSRQLALTKGAKESALYGVLRNYVDFLEPAPASEVFFKNPCRALGTRIFVLKSPRPNEKGVILLDYNYNFPLFLKFFDVPAIMARYHLVLEPSWSGYCDLDILCYLNLPGPVFVQAAEPRDADFLRRLNSNLVVVPIGANNWWIDYRLMSPLPDVRKDVDVIMVAGWARFKRHERVFAALARLKKKGHALKTVLIGYPGDMSLEEIQRLAAYYDVDEQMEFYELLTPAEVNRQLNRARVNLLWSRKEGLNRAIIEGMCAGVPCIVRAGFNYGYRYPHINPQTGCFATEKELPERLLWMLKTHAEFSPRAWVLENMSCQKATAILEKSIRDVVIPMGEKWTESLAVKVSCLKAMKYWQESDGARFKADYEFLESLRR